MTQPKEAWPGSGAYSNAESLNPIYTLPGKAQEGKLPPLVARVAQVAVPSVRAIWNAHRLRLLWTPNNREALVLPVRPRAPQPFAEEVDHANGYRRTPASRVLRCTPARQSSAPCRHTGSRCRGPKRQAPSESAKSRTRFPKPQVYLSLWATRPVYQNARWPEALLAQMHDTGSGWSCSCALARQRYHCKGITLTA